MHINFTSKDNKKKFAFMLQHLKQIEYAVDYKNDFSLTNQLTSYNQQNKEPNIYVIQVSKSHFC